MKILAFIFIAFILFLIAKGISKIQNKKNIPRKRKRNSTNKKDDYVNDSVVAGLY